MTTPPKIVSLPVDVAAGPLLLPWAPEHISVGIVGLGWMATDGLPYGTDSATGSDVPRSHAAAIQSIRNLEVVAVSDLDPARVESFKQRWGDVWRNVDSFTDYREMLERAELDIVCVATPDDRHAQVVIDAVQSGVRGIFCEKPLATSVSEADDVIKAVDEAGAVVNVNYTRRWMPEFRLAYQSIQRGLIGSPTLLLLRNGGPRAMLFRNTSHFIDLACFFAQAEPSWVQAETGPGFDDYGLEYAGDGGYDPATEPDVNIYLAFENGARAFISDWRASVRDIRIEVYGSEGKLEVSPDRTVIHSKFSGDAWTSTAQAPRWTRAGAQSALIETIEGILTGASCSCDAREARKSVAIMSAILESHARRCRVPVS